MVDNLIFPQNVYNFKQSFNIRDFYLFMLQDVDTKPPFMPRGTMSLPKNRASFVTVKDPLWFAS